MLKFNVRGEMSTRETRKSRQTRNTSSAARAAVSMMIETLEDRRLMSVNPVNVGPLTSAPSSQLSATGARLLAAQPTVTGVSPSNGATNVNRGAFVRFDISLIGGAGVDLNTLNTDNV